MRLYTVIDNEIFLKQVAFNNAINASISCEDMEDNELNSSLLSYLDRFLYYVDREDWINNAVCALTSPGFLGKDISKHEVIISFEIDEKDVVVLDHDKFWEYTFVQDQFESGMIFSKFTEERLKKEISNIEEKVFTIDKFYKCLAVVKEIPSDAIKNVVMTRNNPIIDVLKANCHKIARKPYINLIGKQKKINAKPAVNAEVLHIEGAKCL